MNFKEIIVDSESVIKSLEDTGIQLIDLEPDFPHRDGTIRVIHKDGRRGYVTTEKYMAQVKKDTKELIERVKYFTHTDFDALDARKHIDEAKKHIDELISSLDFITSLEIIDITERLISNDADDISSDDNNFTERKLFVVSVIDEDNSAPIVANVTVLENKEFFKRKYKCGKISKSKYLNTGKFVSCDNCYYFDSVEKATEFLASIDNYLTEKVLYLVDILPNNPRPVISSFTALECADAFKWKYSYDETSKTLIPKGEYLNTGKCLGHRYYFDSHDKAVEFQKSYED